MTDTSSSSSKLGAGLISLLFTIYFLGLSASAVYFNYTYARDNGFLQWLFLGQIVPTAKAAIWPYYVVASRHHRAPEGIPRSVRNFFLANDALLRAGERPADISVDANVERVSTLFREAVDSTRGIQREELNALYPGLGDHFLDDAIGSAQFLIDAVATRDQDLLMRGAAGSLRWQQWWNENGPAAIRVLSSRYGGSH